MRAGLYHSLSLYRNRPIWAVAVGGDFALSQEGLTKTVQFFGNNLVQCMKKYSKLSKLFVPFLVVNASSDMVCLQIFAPQVFFKRYICEMITV